MEKKGQFADKTLCREQEFKNSSALMELRPGASLFFPLL
jgi:hypothetical protein